VSADEKRDRRIAAIAFAGTWLVRLLGLTWRIRVRDDAELRRLRADRRPVVFALWHGQMLPLLYHHRGEGVAVLISEHGDGEIIARVGAKLGFRTVRGSTSRGAARALLGLARELRDGNDLAITPDGPRGPAKSFAQGTVIVAQRGNAPIIPTVVAVQSAWRLKSWDRFMIPKPFTTITVAYAPAVYVSGSAVDLESAAAETRAAMLAVEARIGG